jgi:hypothetical protein
MSSLEQQFFIQDVKRAQAEHGRLCDRKDVKTLVDFYRMASAKFPKIIAIAVFIIAQALRETPYVRKLYTLIEAMPILKDKSEQIELIFGTLVDMENLQKWGVKREYQNSKLANFYFKPSIMLKKWSAAGLLAVATELSPFFTVHTRSFEHLMTIKTMRKLHGFGGSYASQCFFRTLIIAMDLPYKCERFVLMGGGADAKKYDKLVAMGFMNMFEINRFLDVKIDALEFAFLLCMGKMLKDKK